MPGTIFLNSKAQLNAVRSSLSGFGSLFEWRGEVSPALYVKVSSSQCPTQSLEVPLARLT